MLWAFLVWEPLLKCDLDLEHLPLLGQWHLSVLLLHAGVLPLCQGRALAITLWWSAARTKMIFKAAFMAFFAKCWTIFETMSCVALTACLVVLVTLTTRSVWAAGTGSFLTTFKAFDHIYCGWLCNSSFWFVAVEVFHHHLVFFCVLEQGLVCHVFSSFLQSHPLLHFEVFGHMK